MKTKKAAQIHAQMKDTIAKKKAQLDKMIQQRRLMQARLKDIYMRNQRKKVSQKYREQPPSFDSPASSSGVSSGSKDSTTFFGTSKNSNSKAKAHPLALYSTNFFSGEPTDKENDAGSAMFGSTSSKKSQQQQRRQSTNERSQANRSPFFA